MVFAIPEFTDVFLSTGKGIGAMSVLFAIPVFTDVFSPTGKGIGALSVEFVILPFTDVLVPIGIDEGAKAVMEPLGRVFGTRGQTAPLCRTEQEKDKGQADERSHGRSLTENVGNEESDGEQEPIENEERTQSQNQ